MGRARGWDMPILSTIDHEHSQIRAVAVGPVTYADVESHLQQEKAWKSLSYREFIDGRGAGLVLTSADVRRIVEMLRSLSRESKLGRTAILVSTDYAYGLMRMLEMLVEDVCQIRVFREEQEARAWLNAMSAGNSSK